jgi:two-component system chemotaxis response regulator CheY
VDDSKGMRSIVMRSLRQAGYDETTFFEATNGVEALDLVRKQSPDLVLSDWNMPEMSGIELLQALRAEGLRVRLGFVTSESSPQMHELATASGAAFLVTKPFTPDALRTAIEGATV